MGSATRESSLGNWVFLLEMQEILDMEFYPNLDVIYIAFVKNPVYDYFIPKRGGHCPPQETSSNGLVSFFLVL